MQHSSKKIKYQDLEKELLPIINKNYLDLIIGAAQMVEGLFVLLFSHRLNKEVSILVVGKSDRSEVVEKINDLMRAH